MKRQILLLSLAVVSLIGCSKKEGSDPAPAAAVVVPTPTPSGTGTTAGSAPPSTPGGTRGSSTGSSDWYWKTGGSAIFKYDNVGVFERYTGRPMNNPSAIKMNVAFTDSGNGTFGGTVKIGYYDADAGYGAGQKYYEGAFDAGSSALDVQYNYWVTPRGTNQSVFHAFAEDAAGGLIFVVDGKDDNDLLRGSIYFKNYNWDVCNSHYPYQCAVKAPKKCWLIQLGPYDCRDFINNNGDVDPTWSIYPNSAPKDQPSPYTRLGTFEGLDYKKAFNK